MFEKNELKELYTREDFTFEEGLFQKYLDLRSVVNKLENIKYKNADEFATSNDFKQGFLAGIKVMSSIFIDV